jgi:HK97 family phage major capsid protein
MIPAATAYETARTVAGDKRVDLVHHAVAQLADAGLAATGIVLNLADYSRMVETKDDNGAYIGPGPFGPVAAERLWGVPVVGTPALTAGTFLVGDFETAVTLFDRMAPETLISSEHSDYFARNLLLVRNEERVALALHSPWALVTGSFGAVTA